MAFWHSLFQKVILDERPDLHFGRFSDAYKDVAQYDAWDQSLKAFEDESYLTSIRHFFTYLNDSHRENARCWEENGKLKFELLQGSKLIRGMADNHRLRAEAKIATGTAQNIGLLRRLVELNYGLKYSRYALDPDGQVTLVFDTFLLDGSPYKLYYALKEIATHADKQDDLLIGEFDELEPINTGHLGLLDDSEVSLKYRYFKQELARLFQQLTHAETQPKGWQNGKGHLVLQCCYKMDYLLSPEGVIMEAFERIHRNYFTNNQQSQSQKIEIIKKELRELDAIDELAFTAEVYKTISTFGIASPVGHSQIKDLIQAELPKMDWFADDEHHYMQMAIPNYIVGFSLFNYAVPEPLKELFHLYYRIFEPDFFEDLGISQSFRSEKGQLNKRFIRKYIDSVLEKYTDNYPYLKWDEDQTYFDSDVVFARSFLQMLHQLDLTKSS